MASVKDIAAIAAAANAAGAADSTEKLVAFTMGFTQAHAELPSPISNVKLTYFDGPGRAEAIRLILKCGEIKFEDKRLGFPDWGAMKQDPTSVPAQLFGTLPVLEDGDFKLGQSRAVQSYAADIALPATRKTAKARAIDTMFQNAHADAQTEMYKCLFGSDESKAAAMEVLDESLQKVLQAIERNIPESGFIKGGSQPSAADLVTFDLLSSKFPGLNALGVKLEAYPKLVALGKLVASYPSVAAYCQERGF